MQPEGLADRMQQVGESGTALLIPGGLLPRQIALRVECIGQQDDQRGEAQERRGGASDRQVTPLALGFDVQAGPALYKGDFLRATNPVMMGSGNRWGSVEKKARVG